MLFHDFVESSPENQKVFSRFQSNQQYIHCSQTNGGSRRLYHMEPTFAVEFPAKRFGQIELFYSSIPTRIAKNAHYRRW